VEVLFSLRFVELETFLYPAVQKIFMSTRRYQQCQIVRM